MRRKYIMMRFFAYIADYYIVSMLAGLVISSTSFELYAELLEKTTETPAVYDEAVQTLLERLLVALADDSLYIMFVFIFYYVMITKLLGGKTLGCMMFRQKIAKTDGSKLTYSDLTIKMLFTNSGILYLAMCIVLFTLASQAIVASLLLTVLVILYFTFLITNVIFLFIKGTSLVDIMSKTKPLLVLKVPQKKF